MNNFVRKWPGTSNMAAYFTHNCLKASHQGSKFTVANVQFATGSWTFPPKKTT